MNGQLRIDNIWAYICLDDDNTEGIAGWYSPDGPIPMIGADEARIKSLRPLAEELARSMGKKITLCRFSVREELEVIE